MKNIIYKGIDYLKFPIRVTDYERALSIKNIYKISENQNFEKYGYENEGLSLVIYKIKERKLKELKEEKIYEGLEDIEVIDSFISKYIHSSIDFKGYYCHINQQNLKEKILEDIEKLKKYGIEVIIEDNLTHKHKCSRIDYCYDLCFENETYYTRFVNSIIRRNKKDKKDISSIVKKGKTTYFKIGMEDNFLRVYDKKLDVYDIVNDKNKNDNIKDKYKKLYEYTYGYSEVLRIELQKTGTALRNFKCGFNEIFDRIEDNFKNLLAKKGIDGDYRRLEKSNDYLESNLNKIKIQDTLFNYTSILKGFLNFYENNIDGIKFSIIDSKDKNMKIEDISSLIHSFNELGVEFNRFLFLLSYTYNKDKSKTIIEDKQVFLDKIDNLICKDFNSLLDRKNVKIKEETIQLLLNL